MLDKRAQTLLKTLIERYIAEGQPVGSRTLSKYSGLDLSPATIRNVMSDLEEMGLIASPHTSAGRIPTDLGYRHYVDALPARGKLRDVQRRAIAAHFAEAILDLEEGIRVGGEAADGVEALVAQRLHQHQKVVGHLALARLRVVRPVRHGGGLAVAAEVRADHGVAGLDQPRGDRVPRGVCARVPVHQQHRASCCCVGLKV